MVGTYMAARSKDTGVWKKYLIFISSTFKDMDAERDAIKFDVQKRLNEKYRKYCIQFQFIDLRMGVNTEGLDEATAENEVLEICLHNIDKARPFFIAIIGNRYGWVPDHDRVDFVLKRLDNEKRVLIGDSEGKSVTELEILYGAIGKDGKHIGHSLFFFRDEESYRDIPDNLLSDYNDRNNSGRLDHLKKRIVSLVERMNLSEQCNRYSLTWNPDTLSFSGLDTFADLVFDRLCREIDKDFETMSSDISWISEEEMNTEYFLQNNTEGKDIPSCFVEVCDSLYKHRQICLVAPAGYGKEVLMSHLCRHVSSSENMVCLAAFAGSSQYSQTMTPILVRWITRLQKEAGEDVVELDSDDSNNSYSKARKEFLRLAGKLRECGKEVAVFLDNMPFFEKTRYNDLYAAWAECGCLLVTTSVPEDAERIVQGQGIHLHYLPKCNSADNLRVLEDFERQFNFMIPSAVSKKIAADETMTPQKIALLMTLFSSFSGRDFSCISKSNCAGSEIDKINSYILSKYDGAPDTDTGLFCYVLHGICESLGYSSVYEEAVRFLALSRIGLRDSDLETLFSCDDFNMLHFRTLAYIMRDFIYEHPYTRRWYLRKNIMPYDIVPSGEMRRAYYSRLVKAVSSLDDDEPQKTGMLFYYSIMSGDPEISSVYLAAPESGEYFTRMYSRCRYYLINDVRLRENIEYYCDRCDDMQRIRFLNGFLDAAGGLWNIAGLQFDLVEQYLDDIEPAGLDCDSAYRLGWIYSHCKSLTDSSKLQDDIVDSQAGEMKEFFIDRAIACYERCYSLEPKYMDVKNMYKAMLTAKMQFMKDSSFDELENYYLKIKEL